MHFGRAVFQSSAALLLGLSALVAAHGEEHGSMEGMHMGGEAHSSASASATAAAASVTAPVIPSYFNNETHQGWLYAHIATMFLAWVVVLPIGIMVSITRSRLTIPSQLSFLAINALGVFTSIIYNAQTPDLYPNNAHHKIGWVATSIVTAWFVMALPVIYRKSKSSASHAMTAGNMAQYERLQTDDFTYRFSGDSGHGTDHSATLAGTHSRASSSASIPQHKLGPQSPVDEEGGLNLGQEEPTEDGAFLAKQGRVEQLITMKLSCFSPPNSVVAVIKVLYIFIERSILVLGFMALLTGGITISNLFRDRLAFSGAAHFAKGGIFFWYGILTLGRWMGAFADYGWAWNIKPHSSSKFAARMPSAEFTESFVMWLYGATNVFLEHLNAWGKPWHMEDFQHVSITIMFFGGGLLGMLVESEKFRTLFNTSVALQEEETLAFKTEVEKADEQHFAKPKSYRHSLNPMPALVIMLLGKLMGGHHQASAVSAMMHAQWGNLFLVFGLARAATYALLYVSPPTSYFPSRPPTELVASFCLVSGGMIFMGSATDTVRTIEQNGLDAMFLFTVAMGFSALIMAWAAIVFAIKGWVMRREAKRA